MTANTIIGILTSANIILMAWLVIALISARRSQKRADEVFEAMVLASTMRKDAA